MIDRRSEIDRLVALIDLMSKELDRDRLSLSKRVMNLKSRLAELQTVASEN
jgi:hypothetical protein